MPPVTNGNRWWPRISITLEPRPDMIAFLKRLWSAAPLATALLALALAATALFGVRTALIWGHRHDRFAGEQPIQAWMTPRFIAHSWHVPPEVILEALDAPMPPPNGPMNLEKLAEFNGTSVEALIAAADGAIAAWRAKKGGRKGRSSPEGKNPDKARDPRADGAE